MKRSAMRGPPRISLTLHSGYGAPGDHAWPCCRFMRMSCRTARRSRFRPAHAWSSSCTARSRSPAETRAMARPGTARRARRGAAGAAGGTCWRWELAPDGGAAAASGATSREKLAARLDTLPTGDLLLRGDSVALSARRLRLPAPPPGPGHPLPDRGRHPHRHPRPLDLLRTGRRLVRERARAGVRASRRRPAEPLHPGDDPAARADRQELDPVMSTRPTRTSRGCSSTKFSPTRRSRGRGVSAPVSPHMGPGSSRAPQAGARLLGRDTSPSVSRASAARALARVERDPGSSARTREAQNLLKQHVVGPLGTGSSRARPSGARLLGRDTSISDTLTRRLRRRPAASSRAAAGRLRARSA